MSKRTRRKNLRESILPECAEFAAAYKNTGAAGRYDLYKGAKTIKSSIVDSGLYVCENDFVADVFDVLFKNKTDETKGMYEDEKRKIYNDVETTFHYVKNYEEFVQEVKSSVGKAMAKSIIQMAGEKINLKGSPDTIMKAMPPDESSPEETKAEDGEETEEGTKNEADSGDAVEKENKVGVFSSVFSFFFGSSVASKEEVPTGATSVKDHFAEFTRLEKENKRLAEENKRIAGLEQEVERLTKKNESIHPMERDMARLAKENERIQPLQQENELLQKENQGLKRDLSQLETNLSSMNELFSPEAKKRRKSGGKK